MHVCEFVLCVDVCLFVRAQLIRELKEEVAKLRVVIKAEGLEGKVASFSEWRPEVCNICLSVSPVCLSVGGMDSYVAGEGGVATAETITAREKLKEAEKLIAELNETWEDKLKRTETIQKER